uniref:Uncharacterized protein n=1 Tax=Cacopsylla melanoneura TaxID=428564 RepID=A0A8D8ZTK7_9HEMI
MTNFIRPATLIINSDNANNLNNSSEMATPLEQLLALLVQQQQNQISFKDSLADIPSFDGSPSTVHDFIKQSTISHPFGTKTRLEFKLSATTTIEQFTELIKENISPNKKYALYFSSDDGGDSSLLYIILFSRTLLQNFVEYLSFDLTKCSQFLEDISDTEKQLEIIKKYHLGNKPPWN